MPTDYFIKCKKCGKSHMSQKQCKSSAGAALLDISATPLRDNDVYCLMGHAAYLQSQGQKDMPEYFLHLALRIAKDIGDDELFNKTLVGVTKLLKGKNMFDTFIVELETGVWIAPWNGDPGRTLDKGFATVFCSEGDAKDALKHARTFRPFPNAKLQPSKAELDYCDWKRGELEDERDSWTTDCGNLYLLIDGTPKDNDFNFCPGCGRHIREI